MKYFFTAIAFFCILIAQAQNSNDQKAVEQAVYNYIDAFYQGDTTRAHQSVAGDLAKRGYYNNKEGRYVDLRMTFAQLIRLAQTWKNGQNLNAESPRKVTVFEVLDQTATAKCEAVWGIDYLHLAKIDGTWKIVNVLWQSAPKKNQ